MRDCFNSPGYYLDEWSVLALSQVDAYTWTIDHHAPGQVPLSTFRKIVNLIVQMHASTWLSAQTGHSSKWYPRLMVVFNFASSKDLCTENANSTSKAFIVTVIPMLIGPPGVFVVDKKQCPEMG